MSFSLLNFPSTLLSFDNSSGNLGVCLNIVSDFTLEIGKLCFYLCLGVMIYSLKMQIENI